MSNRGFQIAAVLLGVMIVIAGLLVVALTHRDDTGLGTELLGITIVLLGISARKLAAAE